MQIREYRDTDGQRRWELSYEGILLVLLNDDAPKPWRSQLLGFDGQELKLIWCLSPELGPDNDRITNVWVKGGQVWAHSFSGFTHSLNYRSGQVLESRFTK
jgi:hypothetical protein